MKHLGDITKISGYDAPIVDCVIFGAPCQDLSVAGKRAGMKHSNLGDEEATRSGLFMEAVRIIKEMRDKDVKTRGSTAQLVRPRFAVYENVPGAFSSNKGEDFKIVLEELAKVIDKDAVIPMPEKGKWTNAGAIVGEGWSIAWRVLDGQFWGCTYVDDDGVPIKLGTPQRRKRIALVADFGGECAPEILFERTCLRGNTSQSGSEGQGVTSDTEGGSFADDSKGEGFDGYNGCLTGGISSSLGVNCGMSTGRQGVICYGIDCYNQAVTGDKAKALTNRATDSDHIPCVAIDRAFFNQGKNALYDPQVYDDGSVPTLVAKGPSAVAYSINHQGGNVEQMTEEIAGTLTASMNSSGNNKLSVAYYSKSQYIVRRLTPMECERLQGYPDLWTDIGDFIDTNGKKKTSSDAVRYKALGNSICLPPWKWVLKRLCSHYERDATMASLFDGIGGFPYLWEQINGKGTAVWASEIEEFPVAVTKKRIN